VLRLTKTSKTKSSTAQ